MQYYITEYSMLKDEKLKNLLMSDSKKQREIILFVYPDVLFNLEEHILLQNAVKRIPIEYRTVKSQEEFLLTLGIMFGEKCGKNEFYTVLSDNFTIPEFVAEKYNVQPFQSMVKNPRKQQLKPAKSTTTKPEMTIKAAEKRESEHKEVPLKNVKEENPVPKAKEQKEKRQEIGTTAATKEKLKTEKTEISEKSEKSELKPKIEDNKVIEKREKPANVKSENANSVKKEAVVNEKDKKKNVKLPSLKEGTDRNLFIKLIGITPEEVGYNGTMEELALAIGDVMIDVRDNDVHLQAELYNKFGTESGKKIYQAVQSKYLILTTTLRQ